MRISGGNLSEFENDALGRTECFGARLRRSPFTSRWAIECGVHFLLTRLHRTHNHSLGSLSGDQRRVKGVGNTFEVI